MDSSLIVNRHALVRLALERPRSRADLARVDGLLDWQVEVFGDEILGVVSEFERDLKTGGIELKGRRRGRRRPGGNGRA